MRASELISKLSAQIGLHGDMEIYFDCDSMLEALESVTLLNEPFVEVPVLVIHPLRHAPVEDPADPR